MHFSSVGLIAKTGSQQVLESLERVLTFLRSQDLNIVLESASAERLTCFEKISSGDDDDDSAAACVADDATSTLTNTIAIE